MLKPTAPNILLYIFLKYIAFYVFMMFKNNDFYLLEVNNIENGEDLFYYLWIFLFLPVVCMVVFSAPLYFSFKVGNAIYFLLTIGVYLVVEYFIYTYLASQADLVNGLFNGLISVMFFFYFSINQLNHPSSAVVGHRTKFRARQGVSKAKKTVITSLRSDLNLV